MTYRTDLSVDNYSKKKKIIKKNRNTFRDWNLAKWNTFWSRISAKLILSRTRIWRNEYFPKLEFDGMVGMDLSALFLKVLLEFDRIDQIVQEYISLKSNV
ncbi:unnamed protein product [Rhizophagus irregularis]|nr:unnamed protein product [Rhizophagus irregularis]CAB5368765.1 unnamed protein product [Rhizophagus irregularis]